MKNNCLQSSKRNRFVGIVIIAFLLLNFFTNATADNSEISRNVSIPKVLIYPNTNSDFVIETLKQAKESIAFSALTIPTKEFAEEIANAANRGVKVYIIITNPFFEVGTNYTTMSQKFSIDVPTLKYMKDRLLRDVPFLNILTDNNIYPHYLDRKYYINHQKLLIVDDLSFIFTSPRGSSSKGERRDFGITISEKEKVDELRKFFFRDYYLLEHVGETLEKLGFVVGPENQRKLLEDFLLSAKKSVHIYAAEFDDKSICTIIERLLEKSVKVHVITTPNFFGFDEESLNADYYLKRIKQFGAKIKIVREPFIHSKIIIIDGEDIKSKKMYFGSCNIFKSSIDHSRELGLITQAEDYIKPIFNTFLTDWNRGADF